MRPKFGFKWHFSMHRTFWQGVFLTLFLLGLLGLTLVYCSTPDDPAAVLTKGTGLKVAVEPSTTIQETTTSSTVVILETFPPVVQSPERSEEPTGPDLWAALRWCESQNGALSNNLYQFSSDTAAKVGINGSESEQIQTAAAQLWASEVDPGSTAGWPVCWWVALNA